MATTNKNINDEIKRTLFLPFNSIKFRELVPDISIILDGEPLLHIASSLGNIDAIRYLLENGIDINMVDTYGRTAIYYCKYPEHINLIGSDLNHRDNRGRTALYYYCSIDYILHAEELLLLGANVNIPDLKGRTPLMEASHPVIIELLLQYKSDYLLTDNEGFNALLYHTHNIDGLKLLIKYGLDINTPVADGGDSVLLIYIEDLSDEPTDEDSFTEMLDLPGLDINRQYHMGETALISLGISKDIYHMEILLKRGANPNLFFTESMEFRTITLLQWMCMNLKYPIDTRIIELLLRYGADPNLTMVPNLFPIVITGDYDVIKLLLQYGARVPDRIPLHLLHIPNVRNLIKTILDLDTLSENDLQTLFYQDLSLWKAIAKTHSKKVYQFFKKLYVELLASQLNPDVIGYLFDNF